MLPHHSSNNLMRAGKLSQSQKKQAIFLSLGLTFCYQVCYQLGWLEEDDSFDNDCEGALGVDGLSPECLEIELFRSWRRVEVVGPDFNETVEDLERIAQQKLVNHMNSVTPAPSDADGSSSSVFLGTVSPHVTSGSAGKIEDIYKDTTENLDNRSSNTPFARSFMDTQADMQYRLDRLTGAEQRRHQRFDDEFNKLEHDILESIHKNTTGAYADNMNAIMEELEARKANLTSEKRAKVAASKAMLDKLYGDTLGAIESNSHTNDYAEHLKAIRDQFELLRQQSSTHGLFVQPTHHNSLEELASHNAALEVSQQKMTHDHQEWQEGFSANAADYLAHLCSDEPRRSYPVCAKFVAGEANTATKVVDASSAASSLPVTAFAVGATKTPKATNSARLRGATAFEDRLSWDGLISALRQGSDRRGLGKGLVAVERGQLRSKKWQGRLPSVACVVAIPSGSNVKTQIKHVVENFRSQNYEGQRQLLILYRAPSSTAVSSTVADTEVEDLVREHSDGTFIKGVPVRSHGEFPSTTSLRYAAWSTDSDIIARWTFDEWYHPERLSMQVRALALTSRPVSLLKRWTVLGSENASSGMVLSDDIGWESSIVGETAWMKEHWMPLLYHERQVLGGVQAHSVVQVDMPELSTYIMDTGSWQGALHHFGLANHTGSSSQVPKACLEAFRTGVENPHVESAIVEKLGVELAETYHGLAGKRAEIGGKLRLLCDEVTATKEALQRDLLVVQVEKIAAVQLQLAEHFETVKAMAMFQQEEF